MLTFEEIYDKILERFDAEDLLVLLDIGAEELLNRFDERITTHREEILEAIDEIL